MSILAKILVLVVVFSTLSCATLVEKQLTTAGTIENLSTFTGAQQTGNNTFILLSSNNVSDNGTNITITYYTSAKVKKTQTFQLNGTNTVNSTQNYIYYINNVTSNASYTLELPYNSSIKWTLNASNRSYSCRNYTNVVKLYSDAIILNHNFSYTGKYNMSNYVDSRGYAVMNVSGNGTNFTGRFTAVDYYDSNGVLIHDTVGPYWCWNGIILSNVSNTFIQEIKTPNYTRGGVSNYYNVADIGFISSVYTDAVATGNISINTSSNTLINNVTKGSRTFTNNGGTYACWNVNGCGLKTFIYGSDNLVKVAINKTNIYGTQSRVWSSFVYRSTLDVGSGFVNIGFGEVATLFATPYAAGTNLSIYYVPS